MPHVNVPDMIQHKRAKVHWSGHVAATAPSNTTGSSQQMKNATQLQNMQSSGVLEGDLNGQKYFPTTRDDSLRIGSSSDSTMNASPLSGRGVEMSNNLRDIEGDFDCIPCTVASNLSEYENHESVREISIHQSSMATTSSSRVHHVFDSYAQNDISDLENCSIMRDKLKVGTGLGGPLTSKPSSSCDTSFLTKKDSTTRVPEDTVMSINMEDRIEDAVGFIERLSQHASSTYVEAEKFLTDESEKPSISQTKMTRLDNALELLNTLIHSTVDEMVKINKTYLFNIKVCLQNAQENIEFLQLETKLQQEESQQWSHHSEPISVQKIETDSHKQQNINVANSLPNTTTDLHADVKIQSALPKPIIRPWEQLVHNKHRTGLGYDKDLSFHIPDYVKPIKFQSVGLIHDSSPAPHDSAPTPHDSSAPVVPDSAPLPQQQQQQKQQIMKCQHCDRVGHLKDHCFDLHPCNHCHKTSHSSHRCFKNKRPARTKIHLGWIASWQWASTAKKIFQMHVRTCSRVLNSLAVEFSPSSHLVSDRGGNDGHLQA